MFFENERRINNVEIESGRNVRGASDHSRLTNLDYESSGHTGFASSNDLNNAVTLLSGRINDAGHKIDIMIRGRNFIINLYDKDNNLISTDSAVYTDLDTDTYVASGVLNNGIITFTYNNGNTFDVNIRPMISGLATSTYVDAQITNVYNALRVHEQDNTNPHNVNKAQVGLGNVDNTSDLNKPISVLVQNALNGKVNIGDSGYSIQLILTSDYRIMANLKNRDGVTISSSNTIDLPIESVVVGGSYDSVTKEVVLTLDNGNTIRFSVADLVSGLQDELVSGVNIKTMNGNSVLGSGDLVINTTHAFNPSWVVNSTTATFCDSIVNDPEAEAGMVYLGQLLCNDLPGGLVQGEAIVEVLTNNANGKAIHIMLTSVDTSPYRWEYVRAKVNGSYITPGWKGYQLEITNSNKLSADLVDDTSTTNKFVTSSEKTDIANNTTDRHNHFYFYDIVFDSSPTERAIGTTITLAKSFLKGNGTLEIGSIVEYPIRYSTVISSRIEHYKVLSVFDDNGVIKANCELFGWTELAPISLSNYYDDLYNKPQINGVALSGNKSTADLDIYARTKKNAVASNVTTIALNPNEYYDFGGRSGDTITITLGTEIANILNEYMIEISSDESDVTMVTPADIIWADEDNVTNNSNTLTLTHKYTYQMSIVNKRGLIVSFENGELEAPVLSNSGFVLNWTNVSADEYEVYIASVKVTTVTTNTYDASSSFQTAGTLGTPTNVSVTRGIDSYTANITWTKPSNSSSFLVKCYYHGTSTLKTQVAAYTNSATITGLDMGTEYDFTVQAEAVTGTKSCKVKAVSQHFIDSESNVLNVYYTLYNAGAESPVVTYTTPYGITKSAGNGTLTGADYIYPNTSENFTLTPSTYYELPSSITVTNATLDSYDSSTGAITISNPTGNVTISATCVRITYTVTTNLTNLTSDNDGTINAGGTKTITLTADAGFELPGTITVTGATYTYNNTTGVISLVSPTGNVTIGATGTLSNYTITMSLTDLTSDYDGTTMTINDTKTITLTADAGFDLPSSISVSGASYTYDSTTGEIVLSNPTGNITITANADSGGE